MQFENSIAEVRKLVSAFEEQESYYLSAAYQEQEVRRDFIDNFFTALDWDVGHKTQTNPYKQEVKIEKKTHKLSQRRTDYAFYIAPNFKEPRFFVEAKKPSRNLSNAGDYFQAARYAWNAKHPLVILTDFEEFHIIDARYKPNIATVLERCVKQYHYKEYADEEKFREIFHLFSRQDVENGSIEDFARSLPKPKGKPTQGVLFPAAQAIDDAFLVELDEIRSALAKAFKKRNLEWDGMLLTEATQRTIDRLVMMRFLEDKHIEWDRHVSELGAKRSIWDDFTSASKKLNAKYNGVVFKEHFIDSPACAPPDERVFRDVCDQLSHVNSPYDFNAIPIHILGSVYERFLGKVIIATPKQVKVEDRPEVKKAGGVTYTPQFIVRHIVQRTVGKLIECKTPKQIASMRFADIACGSGSFLIAMFELLIDYHNQWYQEHPAEAERDGCHNIDGQWALSLRRKREILLNNIYGVDIDEQAVEITQLSLYLKLLEDETTATANEMQALFKEKILPDLSRNIVIGNSLIGTDILGGSLFSGEEERAVFPFDFETAFPHIFSPSQTLPAKKGEQTGIGFDAIVGNPPYVRQETLGKKAKDYFKSRYAVAHGIADLYTYFIERGMSLLKPGGLFGYIVANKWMRANYGKPLRSWLKEQRIEEITDFGDLPVFKTVTTYPCLLFLRKDKPKKTFAVTQVKTLDFDRLDNYVKTNAYAVNHSSLDDSGWSLTDERAQALLDKIRAAGKPLGEYVNGKIYYGIKTGLNEAFVIDEEKRDRLIGADPKSKELIKPFLAGRDIKRYEPLPEGRWLILIPNGWTNERSKGSRNKWQWLKDRYPSIAAHLEPYTDAAKKRCDQGEYWWELRPCVYYQEFEKPKIIIPSIVQCASYAYDLDHFYSNDKTSIIPTSDMYLLALLNSKACDFFMHNISSTKQGGFYEYKPMYVSQIPIKTIDKNNSHEMGIRNKIIDLAHEMLNTKKQLASSVSQRDVSFFTNKCASIDRQIDEFVYELYGLTKEEIKVVEGR